MLLSINYFNCCSFDTGLGEKLHSCGEFFFAGKRGTVSRQRTGYDTNIMDLHSPHNMDETLRAQPPVVRMTPNEAQAIIALWQQEQTDNGGLSNRPSLNDVAESLNIAAENARRLLAQVRGTQTADAQRAHIRQERRKMKWNARQARIRRENREKEWGAVAILVALLLSYFLHWPL